jgi:lysophospholipase L1-like esterase
VEHKALIRWFEAWWFVAVAIGCGPAQVSKDTRAPVLERVTASSSKTRQTAETHAAAPQQTEQVSGSWEDFPGRRLFEALYQREAGAANHVRIVWLGDSHTAADFWTGEVRRQLQAKFGDGGPGLVMPGLSGTRNEAVSAAKNGKWTQEPRTAWSPRRQLDGRFGLAGRRMRGFAGSYVKLKRPTGTYRWEVHYAGDERAQLRAIVDGAPQDIDLTAHHEGWTSASASPFANELRLKVVGGSIALLGVVVEAETPGLSLEALGINGARMKTLLAWDQDFLLSQLEARNPDLVVFSYGTNEVGDSDELEGQELGYGAVADRVKASGAACLLIGPTDRHDQAGNTMARVVALDELLESWADRFGCLYFSAFKAMGRSGGYSEWRHHSPQLASSDGVHLTVAGYHVLAQEFVDQLLTWYDMQRSAM